MIVDGKKIAAALYEDITIKVAELHRPPVLAAITCAPNFETKKYLSLKQKKAAEVGITLRVVELPGEATTKDAICCIQAVLPEVDGVVVQLPFPASIDREAVLAAVPAEKDPDGFSYGIHLQACVPPVVGAMAEIAAAHQVTFAGKRVVVLGEGRLVGQPAAIFLKAAGAKVSVITETSPDAAKFLQEAEIIISGIGQPHAITPGMLPSGVIVFDAGTSEEGGVVAGDVHPDVAREAALFTPVPGGIGPLTIAVLLRNLVSLIRQYK